MTPTLKLHVDGMSCGNCVKHVTQALTALPGVDAVDVALASGTVTVSGQLAAGPAPLLAALEEEGYPARVLSEH